MTRSKKDAIVLNRQDKHLSRNGATDSIKKAGAGFANWGKLGDEIAEVPEIEFRDQIVDLPQDTKLKVTRVSVNLRFCVHVS
ncbi:hypothetical protein BX666DRAFT_2027481 [Dichotomocladium elegans]|nr:hypothetical protein BX666DRAFT_2027481 [Dichotomocladium elegans]